MEGKQRQQRRHIASLIELVLGRQKEIFDNLMVAVQSKQSFQLLINTQISSAKDLYLPEGWHKVGHSLSILLEGKKEILHPSVMLIFVSSPKA